METRREFVRGASMTVAGLMAVKAEAASGAKGRMKVAQLGVCHDHASGKIGALRRLTDVFDIVGYVDDRATSRVRFGSYTLGPYKELRCITEEELYAMKDLELVLVEVPNHYLVDTAMRVMEHNLPMHMDKPTGADLAAYKRLLDGCKAKGLPFQMGYMFRSNPAIKFCIKAVKEGMLGDIYLIRFDMNHHYGNRIYQEYMANFKGGVMYNLGCHMIDVIITMLGKPAGVTPFLGSVPGSCCKDNCMAVMEYTHTHVVLMTNGFTTLKNRERELVINGSNGTLVLNPVESFGKPAEVSLCLNKAAGGFKAGTQSVKFPGFGSYEERYMAQLRDMAAIVRGERKSEYSFEHDYAVAEASLRASGML